MIQPSDIQAIVFDGAGPLIQPLAAWLPRFPHLWLASKVLPGFASYPRGPVASPGFIGRMRNLAWEMFARVSDRTWLLMLDDDHVPVPETEALFNSPVPWAISAARYFGKAGKESHPEDGFVACGCLLVHRQAVEMIGPDPFTANPDEGCECMAFCRRARAAGLWPKHVGAIGHRCLVDVLPSGEDTYKIRFPQATDLSRQKPKQEAAHFDEGGHLLSGPQWLRDQLAAQRPLGYGLDVQTGVLPPRKAVALEAGGGVVTEQTFVNQDPAAPDGHVHVRGRGRG